MLTDNKIKKCLAPRRDFRPSNIQIMKGIETPENQIQNEKNLNLNNIGKKTNPKQKQQSLAYEQKYRNKNITIVPASLLNIFSGMNVLDISYNSLNDSQIELVMSSCQKLVTLCIQGNFNTLIPVSISKMKQLRNFKHDWVNICLGTEDSHEPEDRLQLIKSFVKKPQHIVKSNKISGMNFQIYSTEVSKTTLDFILYKKIQNSNRCSEPAKQAMYKCIKSFQQKTKNKKWLKNLVETEELVPCRVVCGLNDRHNPQSKKPNSVLFTKQPQLLKQFSEEETQSGSKNIIIEDIRQITEKEVLSAKPVRYSCLGMPLHEIFGNYDSKPTSHCQVDGLLLKGYNPNQYDSQGLTPYHVCVIHNQMKGMEYLLEISSKNPGFFDLQMPSQKQCRNILHYSVFLKNYPFTKKLIQFGFPVDKRDSTGARMIHLVDQNYQFLLMLRKILKKKTSRCRSQSFLSICEQKKYVKHPERIKDEGKIKTNSFCSETLKAYQQFVSINGYPSKKIARSD